MFQWELHEAQPVDLDNVPDLQRQVMGKIDMICKLIKEALEEKHQKSKCLEWTPTFCGPSRQPAF